MIYFPIIKIRKHQNYKLIFFKIMDIDTFLRGLSFYLSLSFNQYHLLGMKRPGISNEVISE